MGREEPARLSAVGVAVLMGIAWYTPPPLPALVNAPDRAPYVAVLTSTLTCLAWTASFDARAAGRSPASPSPCPGALSL
jgi:hypothetical protein